MTASDSTPRRPPTLRRSTWGWGPCGSGPAWPGARSRSRPRATAAPRSRCGSRSRTWPGRPNAPSLCRGRVERTFGFVHVPEVRYARCGDLAIAYQVVGEGPVDLVFARGDGRRPVDVLGTAAARPPYRGLRRV